MDGSLAILETPYLSVEGHTAPVQFAQAVDPSGVLGDVARWLGRLAERLDQIPADIAGEAADTLRRGVVRYDALMVG